ncbi:hypothetical protein POTOM_054621 [Populus tomentosa]|uniref:Uncharacterized protein n=1 Tax=Populus tomentosa TaxID=118781 RepID=A0A8X7Y1X6_POPTO|nr:hypothetical protein POTOM_054621 [Populus tomentosa]
MQQQGQTLLDDFSWMDSLTGGEIWLAEENVVPGMHMPDAPETGLGIEPADQQFEMDMNNITSSLTRDVELSSGIESRELMQAVTERGSCSKMPVDKSVPSSSNNEGINAASTALRALEMEEEEQPLSDERGRKGLLIGGETELVEEPRAPVVLMPDEPETRQRTEQAHQSFEMNLNNISSSSMRDFELRIGYCGVFCKLREIVIHKCHRMKVLLPPWLLSKLQLQVIGVEECDGMEEIVGTDEEGRTHQRIVDIEGFGDCPQLTRIPFTISHSLKKIEADPERLLNTVEHF